jgi:hypothetical protein
LADTLAVKICSAITPLLGSVLASVTVDVEVRRMGKEPDALEAGDLAPLSMAVERHLISFVGPDLAQAAAARVREVSPL